MAESPDIAATLKPESKVITKELIEKALRYKTNSDDFKVETFAVTPGSQQGDNYATIAFAVKITASDKHGEKRVFDWFVKAAHDNEMIREWTFKESKIFVKETKTYTDIIPDMIQYQKALGIELIGPSVPEYVYGVAESNTGILIMEDLRPHGYRQCDRRVGLDYDHCSLVMTDLAAFHALGYALKNGSPENLKKYGFLFRESLFFDKLPLSMDKCFESSLGIIKTVATESNTIQVADKLLKLDLFPTVKEQIKPKEPYAVICHGDMWSNNMLFKYEDVAVGQRPIAVKLLDLQIVRYALPTADLAYFFYTSATRDTLKNHLEDLLHIYHDALSEFLKRLKVDFVIFSFEELKKMFKQNSLFGVISACFATPAFLTQPKMEFVTNEDEVKTFLEDFFRKMVEMEENTPIIKNRLLGMFEDAIERCVI